MLEHGCQNLVINQLEKGLESWEKEIGQKEKRKMQEAVEVFALYNRSTKWEGTKILLVILIYLQDVANFDPSVIAMTLTDSLKRDETGGLNRSGKSFKYYKQNDRNGQ